MLLSPLAETFCGSGKPDRVKSGASTPRSLPPLENLQSYFKMIEDQEERALAAMLKELDNPELEKFD